MNIKSALDDGTHGSSAQKSVWYGINMLAAFDTVEIEADGFCMEDIIKGENEFYLFMKQLYHGMYDAPDKYLIPDKPYDEYMKNNDNIVRDHEKEHYNDTKESKLRNTFQQAIQFYPELFYKLGESADEITKCGITISKEKFEAIKESFKHSYIYKENESRISVLCSLGLKITQAGMKLHIANEKYPKMFLGLWVLCSAPESKFKYMNYLRLDYKGYYRQMPDVGDITATMRQNDAEAVDAIISSLEGRRKMKFSVKPMRSIVSSHEWKVTYTVNNKSTFGFYASPLRLIVCIYFGKSENITETALRLEKEDSELFKWFCEKIPERQCKCRYNRAVTLQGVKRRICGMANKAEIESPTGDDVAKCIRLMEEFML